MEGTMDQLTQTVANKPQNPQEQINITVIMDDDARVDGINEQEQAALTAYEAEIADAQEIVASGRGLSLSRRQKLVGALGLGGGMSLASLGLGACHTADPVNCALSSAAESCWDLNTGIRRNDGSGIERWTTAQVLSGQAGLPRVVGKVTLNAGDTYANKWVDGCIEVKGSNVTITNVLVRGGENCAGGPEPNEDSALISTGYNSGNQISNLKVNDSVIIGTNPSQDIVGIGASSYELEGSDVSGVTKGAIMDHNVIVANNYIHDLAAGAQHGEALFMGNGPGNVTVYNNWMRAKESPNNSGGIALYNNWVGGAGSNINIIRNYIDGDNNGVGFRGGAYGQKPGEFYYDILFAGNVIESNTVWPEWHSAEAEAWCDTCPNMEWGHPDIGPNVNEFNEEYPEPTPVW